MTDQEDAPHLIFNWVVLPNIVQPRVDDAGFKFTIRRDDNEE